MPADARESAGTGLALAHTLATQHGGASTSAPRDLGGARFTLRLPGA